jgi:hypothetical protein
VVQFGKEASHTRDCCVAENAALRTARPDSSLRKERLLGMTIKLHHYPGAGWEGQGRDARAYNESALTRSLRNLRGKSGES